jgi:ribosomal protein S18 acetylase RimI-like enzyme
MLEVLPWDSAFFGFRVGRLHADTLTPAVASAAREWCRANRVSCLYYLGSAVPDSVPEGFRPVDERVTFFTELRAGDPSLTRPTPGVRRVQPGDLSTLEAIARCSHRDSRFYSDPGFDRARCDDLYATWIRRCYDRGASGTNAVFVATDQNRTAGYVTCGGHSIELIAVAESSQGRGLGKQLVSAALQHFFSHGVHCVEVVTQGRNQAARRLYSSFGFQISAAQHWYHLHV